VTDLVRVVCRPALAPGFALAGLPADSLPAGEDTEAFLAGLTQREETGVLLLQDEIYDGLPEELRGRLDRSARPLIVPFPGPAWIGRRSAEERVIELLRRAIGYRVKLR
jgi:V/A-type H+/Na+-transporting ATPase subunit F